MFSHLVWRVSTHFVHRFKWQQDKPTGVKTYKPDNILPDFFFKSCALFLWHSVIQSFLLDVFRNECINSLVWIRCPKHKFHLAKVVCFAVALAVCHFHSGAASREGVMFCLTIPGGAHTEKSWYNKDRKREAKSDPQASEKCKH